MSENGQTKDRGVNSRSSRRPHRPGKGLFTLFIFLFTVTVITLTAVKNTFKLSILYVLPIYCCFVLLYIFFLCCIGDKDEEDEYNPTPTVLKIHLECTEKGCTHDGSCELNMKRDKTTETNRTLETIKIENFDDHEVVVDLSDSDVESRTIDLGTTPTEEKIDTSTISNDSSSSSEQFLVANVFAKNLPTVSKSMEGIESNFHKISKQLRHKIQPPHNCYRCMEGATLNDSTNLLNSHGNNFAEFENNFVVPPELYVCQPCTHGSKGQRVNITGRFKLVHNHNYEKFLKSQNVPFLLLKAVLAQRPIHKYTHEDDTLRVQIDGIVKGDTTFVINGPSGESNIRHLKFDDHVTYTEDGKGIQIRKICRNPPKNGAVELLITRTLNNDGHNLMIFSKARFEDGTESTEAIQTYHRLER